MATKDYTEQLHLRIKELLKSEDLGVFESHWDMAKELLKDSPIRRYYLYLTDDYANLAILTDGWILDVTGDEDEGSLNVTQLRALGQIEFHEDPIPNIPDSKDAELVMIAFQFGAPSEYRYWVADNAEEREHLLRFGRATIQAVSRLT